jgi:hypothetical protein
MVCETIISAAKSRSFKLLPDTYLLYAACPNYLSPALSFHQVDGLNFAPKANHTIQMRLLHVETKRLHTFADEAALEYAILSHTWHEGDVLFEDLQDISK